MSKRLSAKGAPHLHVGHIWLRTHTAIFKCNMVTLPKCRLNVDLSGNDLSVRSNHDRPMGSHVYIAFLDCIKTYIF